MLLVVADEVHQVVELRSAQHHDLTLLLHAAVLDLPLRPENGTQTSFTITITLLITFISPITIMPAVPRGTAGIPAEMQYSD